MNSTSDNKRLLDGQRDDDANRDPISGATGAHPLGTGLGAAAGGVAGGVATAALAGAVTGSVVGPVGTAVGAAVGAIVGDLAGKAIAEAVDPTQEDLYWRENYSSRPYVTATHSFDDYRPAYGMAANKYSDFGDRPFQDVEQQFSREWPASRGASKLEWEDAKHATRDAWDRLSKSDRSSS
jgi:hypothetical protein